MATFTDATTFSLECFAEYAAHAIRWDARVLLGRRKREKMKPNADFDARLRNMAKIPRDVITNNATAWYLKNADFRHYIDRAATQLTRGWKVKVHRHKGHCFLAQIQTNGEEGPPVFRDTFTACNGGSHRIWARKVEVPPGPSKPVLPPPL